MILSLALWTGLLGPLGSLPHGSAEVPRVTADRNARMTRLHELMREAGIVEVDLQVLERWVGEHALAEADSNGDGYVDSLEFEEKFPDPDLLQDFDALKTGATIDLAALRRTSNWKTKAWKLLPSWSKKADGYLALGGLLGIYEALTEEEEGEKAERGPGYQENYGLVFRDRREFKQGARAWNLRLVRDFSKTGKDAAPASFEWTHASGEHDTSAHAAAVLHYGTRAGYERLQGYLAFQADRSTADDSEQDRRIFAVGLQTAYGRDLGWLLRSEFELSGRRESDLEEDVERDTLSLEWTPVLGIAGSDSRSGEFWTGNWNPLSGASEAPEWIARPSLALEFTDVNDDGAEDDDFLVPRLEVGARGQLWILRPTLTSSVTGRLSLDTGDDHILQETVLSFPLGGSEMVSLDFTVKSGEEGPTYERVRVATVGLGIKL